MKEHIYTIPVMDGFKEKGECPFCNMQKVLNKNAIDFMLGPSYMESDIRMDTNKIGFCTRHYTEMYNESNRLGLALLVHTHLQKINKDLESLAGDSLKPDDAKKGRFSLKLGTKRSDKPQAISDISDYLKTIESSCYICNKINHSLEQFIDTFFYLWKMDKHIINFVQDSQGFCITHFAMLLESGQKKLNPKDYANFIEIALPKQLSSLKRVEEDIDWFIKKFDYKNSEEPWNNSKDALPRALLKIGSVSCEEN